MTNLPRDGVIHANGLSAEFRFLSAHPVVSTMSFVQTALGEHLVYNNEMTYDPPRDLSPEAAAVVAKGDNL